MRVCVYACARPLKSCLNDSMMFFVSSGGFSRCQSIRAEGAKGLGFFPRQDLGGVIIVGSVHPSMLTQNKCCVDRYHCYVILGPHNSFAPLLSGWSRATQTKPNFGRDNKRRKCVIVPESTHVKRKRSTVTKSVLEQTLDDGSAEMFVGQTERKFSNAAQALRNETSSVAPSAVGVSLQDMDKGGSSTSARTQSSATMQPQMLASVATRGRQLLQRRSSAGSCSSVDNTKSSQVPLRTRFHLGVLFCLSCSTLRRVKWLLHFVATVCNAFW